VTNPFYASGYLDISLPIHAGMITWPGDPDVCVDVALSTQNGDPVNLSRLHLGTHTGTHVDAPRHFDAQAQAVDAMPPDPWLGLCHVLPIAHTEAILPEELDQLPWPAADDDGTPITRVLFKTRNSRHPWGAHAFDPDFIYLHPEAAQFLVARGVRLVGVDYLSVDGYRQPAGDFPTHRALLAAGVYILEGLCLFGVTPGVYDLFCLPLRIAEGDGAPARVLLKPAASRQA
jgi:arylformamidase